MKEFMKKIFALSLTLFTFTILLSCENKKSQSQVLLSQNQNKISSSEKQAKKVDFKKSENISYEELMDFFNPDYDFLEPEDSAKTYATENSAKTEKSKNQNQQESSQSSQSIIPGLRKLSEYKTPYSTQKNASYAQNPQTQNFATEEENKNDSKEFFVEDWGPKKIVSESENPTFYVIFSQAAHRLSALEEPSSSSEIMTISPKINGVFRWYGTKYLAFESSESAQPGQEYTISLNKNLKSLSGNPLVNETNFKTQAQKIKITNLYGGFYKNGEYYNYYSNYYTGVIPPYDKTFYVRLNYPITLEKLNEILEVKINNISYDFSAESDYNEDAFYWAGTKPKFDKTKQTSNSFIVNIKNKIPFNTSVFVSIKDSDFQNSSLSNSSQNFDLEKLINSLEENSDLENSQILSLEILANQISQNQVSQKSYETLKKFSVRKVNSFTNHSENKKLNPLEVQFSQKPELKSLIKNTKFDFDFTLSEDNVLIEESRVYFFNLPISSQEKHKIIFSEKIKDVYGQNLTLEVGDKDELKTSYDFTVSSPVSYSKFQNYGTKIMEAQFPHKIIFEYQNILASSKYFLEATKNPLDTNYFPETKSDFIPIEVGEKDKRHFAEINFDDLLTDGFGAIKFEADIDREYYDSWEDKVRTTTDQNVQTIQVSDLGATVRVGVNRLVALVSSMQSGKPVENATVQVFAQNSYRETSQTPFAQGKTNKDGLCVINFTEKEFAEFTKSFEYLWETSPYVKIINGKDSIIFRPSSHNPYISSVYPDSYKSAVEEKQKTFIFVDRGLYKPGETVSFRGIDKTQHLGRFFRAKGDYEIKITKGGWEKAQVLIPTWSGTLSETGGFYGSFKLPDDTEPGTYCIAYNRQGNQKTTYYYFTVAEFERLKIESSVKIPELTYFGGDKISANLSASYLAGGALSNANYDVSCYKQATEFLPENPETQDFTFGPNLNYASREFFQQDEGNLNASGEANLVVNTENISSGSPYLYRIEAAVSDISNQRISSSATVLVHPADFYVGLKRKNGGFAKKGSKLEVDYILVSPSGEKITSLKKVKELNYSLSKKVWTLVNEKSVYDSVYTRWESSEKEESSGKVQITKEGKLNLTPKDAGWYTLKVYGYDSENRYVESVLGFYATGSGALWRGNQDSQTITLTPSKSQYNPGEKAQILMESPLPSGDYLITVEREGIFTQEVRHFDESSNLLEIQIAQNYVPVVYVSVSSYSVRSGKPNHEYGEPDLDKPKSYYGVATLFVNPMTQAFSVKIETDKEVYKPGEKATITLTATKGGEAYSNAELTLLAVDRGVLDLINYHVPNPIEFFWGTQNFPLCVFGGDSRSYLMDPVTYSVKNLQGGDSESASEEKESERKDFRPTALFEPVLLTDENGKAKCTFTLPDNLTTYRITAFGTKDDIFALNEDEIKVQNPINVQVVKPRKLRERDTAELGVLITNLSEKTQNVLVKASVSPLTQEAANQINYILDEGKSVVGGKAFFDGKTEHSVFIQGSSSSVVYFDLAAQESGTVLLSFEIESEVLNEKIKVPLEIEKTFTYETVTMIGTIPQNQTKAQEEFIIPNFAKEGKGSLTFTLDSSRLGILGGAVNYLFDYPYGCLEQQSSKILPLIIFEDYIDVFGLDSQISSPSKLVKKYFKDWQKVQHSDGGFPYWENSLISNYFVSLRIAHIYATAISHGYKSSDLKINISDLLDFLKSEYKAEQKSSYLKAYSAYVLSLFADFRNLLSDDETLELKNFTQEIFLSYKNLEDETLTSISYLALAYKNFGENKKAQELIDLIKPYLQPSERSVSVIEKKATRFWDIFENETEQLAVILQALVLQNPNDFLVDNLIFTLMQNQSKGYWQNTATTAHVLEAIYTYIKQRNLDETNFLATVVVDSPLVEQSQNLENTKTQVMSEKFEGVNAKPKTLKLNFDDEKIANLPREKSLPLEFTKNGKGQLFYTMEMKYALPDEMLTCRDEGLKLDYKIYDAETKEIINQNQENSLVELESGKLYKATIRLETTKDRNFVALRATIPSGAEILDSTFVTSGTIAELETSSDFRHWLSNKTIYDNEIQFFWNTFEIGSSEVSFTFRAVRRGVYPTPPIFAECMYESEIFGRSEGYLFTIK